MNRLIAWIAGLVFALGLGISGMTDPQNVLAFLDVTGAFDPALLFVMMGAVAVYALAYRFSRRRGAPWFDVTFHVPSLRQIDAPLLVGATLFGMGWGLSGYCPGPALVSLVTLRSEALVFGGAMLLGMFLVRRGLVGGVGGVSAPAVEKRLSAENR